MKIKLYLDFDGVILDTIDVTYRMYEDNDMYQDIRSFYRDLDWDYVLSISHPINDSINCIKNLVSSNLYDVTILTHVVTEKEAISKKKYLESVLPSVKFIAVDREIDKCDAVDPTDSVLVDDYMGNLELWISKGGIAIKFSDKGKKYDIMSISSLNMLIDKYDQIKKMVMSSRKNKTLVNLKK